MKRNMDSASGSLCCTLGLNQNRQLLVLFCSVFWVCFFLNIFLYVKACAAAHSQTLASLLGSILTTNLCVGDNLKISLHKIVWRESIVKIQWLYLA